MALLKLSSRISLSFSTVSGTEDEIVAQMVLVSQGNGELCPILLVVNVASLTKSGAASPGSARKMLRGMRSRSRIMLCEVFCAFGPGFHVTPTCTLLGDG
eukprot:3716016-Rhodomonas_salina.1